MKILKFNYLIELIIIGSCLVSHQSVATDFENSIGTKMISISPGEFRMGKVSTDDTEFIYSWDELPQHTVKLTEPFHMSETQITNKQYEMFDSGHRSRRNVGGRYADDDEAVVNVTWGGATAFCEWLSKKEGLNYSLPTEAEWEYVSRAGKAEVYPEVFLNDDGLLNNLLDSKNWGSSTSSVQVKRKPPNNWAVYDMQGNAEEWVRDYYGQYAAVPQANPGGVGESYSRVVRGGKGYFKREYRHSQRRGAVSGDAQWLIGFRIVKRGSVDTISVDDTLLDGIIFQNVKQQRELLNAYERLIDVKVKYDVAYNSGMPKPYIQDYDEHWPYPEYPHQHQPAALRLDNGDLFALWYATVAEDGREMVILGARLRHGNSKWDAPSMFFNIKNRNQTGLSLYQKKDGEIYFVNGVGAGIGYRENLAGIIMKSSDNGATWSKPRKIAERGDVENVFQPINGMQYLTNGSFIIPSDSPLRSKDGASSLWVSKDGGQNWSNSKTSVTGIHAAIVESDNRELIAFGRRMGKKNILPLPVSSSKDFGESFESSNSIFPNIGGGQRASLIKTGPNELVLLSFTNRSYKGQQQMTFEHSEGSFQGLGMFVSVSEDNGETWPWKRLLTHVEDDSEFRLDGGGNTGEFILSRSQAEPAGYSVLVQAPNGVIHAFSSRLHYQFNVSWIKSLPKWR